MRFYLTVLLLGVNCLMWGQFSDDFGDGNFTSNPSWTGEISNFVVNTSDELQLNAPAVTDTSYLSLPATDINNVTWDFFVRMEFNPSSSNYTRIYLVANNADLKGPQNGYFVMLGNTTDEISLYRQDGLSTTEILDGVDDVLDVSTAVARVQVSRDAAGNWEVFRDTSGGYNFVSEGTVMDGTYTTSSYFGVFCRYTSTRSTSFYFDNLGNPYVDGSAPSLVSTTVISSTQLDVQFSEALNQTIAETEANYGVDNTIGVPTSAILDGSDPSLVHLTFSPAFTNGVNYVLTVNNLEDLAGNMIVSPSTSNFFYFVPDVPTANDVIITEFVCDPSPSVGLPEVEYVELYNRSTKTFDLSNWSISDASASANFSTYTLLPGEYVLITALGEGAQFFVSNYTELSLPSLNNSGDAIVIKDDFGNIIDSIYYSDDWYQDAAKYEGGWSIERKHLDAPCNDINNWSASTNIIGGTPAIQNSIWTDQDDLIPPFINDYTVISDSEVLIEFSELLDTSVIAMATITPSVTTLSWQYTSENELTVYPSSLTPGVLYSLNVSSVQDCWSNVMSEQSIIVGLPDSLEAEDLIINEVMFNPLTNGSDYVEIYNNSNKILDLQEVYLANWDDDSIANYKSVTSTQRLIFPQDYILITEDTLDIINDFSIYGLSTMVEADDIPTYPNDSGTVYLLSKDFNVIDYFHYDEDYHFELLSTNDGKALERITFGGGVNNSDNWRTAAENVEWGTPGYQNSQLFKSNLIGEVTVDPQMFSPDSDGYNDVLIITLDLQSTENVVDIEIYDNHGRLVVQLQDNFFIGNQAMFTWDGIADSGEKALIGTYIVLISVIDIEGEQSQYKKAVVLAGNL